MPIRWAVTLAVLLVTSPALADIIGPARIIDGERIRLHGIDAPESRQTCIADGVTWPCGKSATDALAEFIGGAPVRCEEQGTDRYGRTIATCSVRGEGIEAWMVRSGWALAYRRYSQDYVDEEATAQDTQAGLWRGEFVPPWSWRRGERLQAQIDIHTGTKSVLSYLLKPVLKLKGESFRER